RRIWNERRPGRGAPAHSWTDAEARGRPSRGLGQLHRTVGREVAVARSACAPGRNLRDRPPSDEPGREARLRQDHLESGAPELRVLLAAARLWVRSSQGQVASPRCGVPSGFDGGDYFCDASLSYMGEPVVNYLNAIGIRVKLRPIERAAFQKGWIEKKYRGLVQGGNGSFGNAATRIESLVVGGGIY